jgi:hypothetical protein
MNWIHLVGSRDKWGALVNAEMDFGFQQMRDIDYLTKC